MAVATAPRTRKHRPPTPAQVAATWEHECRTAGSWGAYKRTGERYTRPDGKPYSDEWARRAVKAWKEQVAPPSEPPVTTAYIPCPGEQEHRQITENYALLCHLIAISHVKPAPAPRMTVSVGSANSQLPDLPTPTILNVEMVVVPKMELTIRRRDWIRTNARIEGAVLTAIPALVTAADLGIALRHPLLSVAVVLPLAALWVAVLRWWSAPPSRRVPDLDSRAVVSE